VVRLDLPVGMAVSRARFDADLVAAAVASGAAFLPGSEARVGDLDAGSRLVRLGSGHDGRLVAARVVVVATGLGLPGIPGGSAPRTRVARGARVGAGCLLDDGPAGYEASVIHMAVGRDGYVGVVRLGDGRLQLACAIDRGALHRAGEPGVVVRDLLVDAGFEPVPGLETAGWRGTPGLTRSTRPLGDRRLLVLGDAAGYVEPFTGEGIAWALASARAISPLAARAVDRWDARLIDEWAALHRQVVRRRQVLCRAAAAVLRRPWLTRVALEWIARWPRPAGRVVEHLNATTSLAEVS
jgi:flavin-dependent dehydrogenase